tara:strand:- start:738 stop:914 length:177 start_codon:yes stop_codon:yes gene_type:complete
MKTKSKASKVTTSNVSYWIGNDGYATKQLEEAFEVIAAVANGEYPPELLKQEILQILD